MTSPVSTPLSRIGSRMQPPDCGSDSVRVPTTSPCTHGGGSVPVWWRRSCCRCTVRRGNVPPETLIAWEIEPEVVWKKARDNTLWDDPVDRELMISPKGGRVVHVTGGFFASSRLLALDRYLPVKRRQGALAMLPRRHSLLYVELGEEQRLYKDLEALLHLGNLFYRRGSRLVYWRRVLVAKG